MHRILMAIAVVCFAAATASAQAKVFGTFQCDTVDPQLVIPVGDRPDHSLGLYQSKCPYTKPIEIGGAKSTDAVTTLSNDVIGDATIWRGYGVATMDSGDKFFMSYQGAGERKQGVFVRNKGTWSFTGGSGKLNGIKGEGTYTCTPSGCDFEGEYQLAK
jgi:hypothetical protein